MLWATAISYTTTGRCAKNIHIAFHIHTLKGAIECVFNLVGTQPTAC